MSPFGLLIALGLAVMLSGQSCDLGGFTIDDVSDTVRVTNASDKPALVIIQAGQDSGHLILPPGASRTFIALAATTYTIEVASPNVGQASAYQRSLVDLRDDLVELSINKHDSAATPESALAELLNVNEALSQLKSNGLQSCSHAIVSGADNQATITWREAGGISGLWELSCA